ncbi:MAG: phosphatidate cytidylyltransferase, partial [Gammaproteobacteria bacterium]
CFLILMLPSEWLLDASDMKLVAAIAIGWWVVAAGLLWSYPRGLSTVVVLLAGPLTLIPAWLLLSSLHRLDPQGPALTLSLLAIVWAADVGAYLTGRQFGSVKLAPQVSPGKTWEGVGGGVLLAVLTAAVAAAILETNMVAFVAVALAATLVSVIGDLTVSMFKRNVGLKDSGRLLPGHGGVLDRIDSLSAAVPFFFFGLQLAGLWI